MADKQKTPAIVVAETQEKDTHPAPEDMRNKDWVPYGVYSFADLEIYKRAREAAGEIYEATDELQQLIWNIMQSSEIEDKGTAVISLASEFEQLVREKNDEPDEKSKGVFQRLKEAIVPKKKEAAPPATGFMVYKSEDGDYRWMAQYSNNFRDQDYPPEIISAKSHREFVSRVDKGEAPMPELWLWHEKDWKVGDADWVGVDEVGDGIVIALAAGHFDSDKQWVAEALAASGMNGVSHGMPVDTIARDQKDQSIIVTHESREISPLPIARAANKLAAFSTITKENTMIVDKKRQELAEALGFSPDRLSEIEESNKARADKGKAEGLETKESTKAEAETEAVPAETTPTEEDAAAPAETPAESPEGEAEETPLEAGEIADIKAAVLTLAEQVKAISETVYGTVGEALKAIHADVTSLKQSDSDKIKQTVEETPSAAFNDIVKSIIGAGKAEVKEGSDLANQKPKEAPAQSPDGLPNFVSSLWD